MSSTDFDLDAARRVPAPHREERREHRRYRVEEPCRVTFNGREYRGRVVNVSVAGAAIAMDVELALQPPPGTALELFIDRVGRVRAKVSRALAGGIAVAFTLDARRDRVVVATLARVLGEYAASARPIAG